VRRLRDLRHEQRIVLSTGMATRNIGAAMAPLFSIAEMDQRATVMVVLGFPLMVIVALLAAKWFGRPATRSLQRRAIFLCRPTNPSSRCSPMSTGPWSPRTRC
jgi:hypothetical protein